VYTMWHWLRNSEHDQVRFLLKLLAIVISGHVLLIGMVFFAQNYTIYHLDYTKTVTEATQQPVIFLPLHKRAPKKQTISKMTSTQQKVVPTTKKSSSKKQKQERKSAEIAEKTRFMEEKKSLPSKHKKKALPKKVKKQHKPTSKQEKPALKQEAPPRQREQPSPTPAPQEQPTVLSTEQELTTEHESLYIGQEEKFMIALQQALHDEICAQWQVPMGLSKDLVCQVSVLVNWQGVVQEVRIAQSSGVRMYDASARTATTTMKLPKIAWGKEFIITFKQ